MKGQNGFLQIQCGYKMLDEQEQQEQNVTIEEGFHDKSWQSINFIHPKMGYFKTIYRGDCCSVLIFRWLLIPSFLVTIAEAITTATTTREASTTTATTTAELITTVVVTTTQEGTTTEETTSVLVTTEAPTTGYEIKFE